MSAFLPPRLVRISADYYSKFLFAFSATSAPLRETFFDEQSIPPTDALHPCDFCASLCLFVANGIRGISEGAEQGTGSTIGRDDEEARRSRAIRNRNRGLRKMGPPERRSEGLHPFRRQFHDPSLGDSQRVPQSAR